MNVSVTSAERMSISPAGGFTISYDRRGIVVPRSASGMSAGAYKTPNHLQEKPKLPSRMYIAVPTIAMKSSVLVSLICLLSIFLSYFTGVHMVHPFIAILAIIGSVGFYLMGRLVEKQFNV